jgi:putative transposase
MTILHMCEAADVSRAGFYRRHNAPAKDRDLDRRDEIQKIALEFPYYGRRRIAAELKRRGWEVNHKRVHRIMREDNLLCLRRRKFVVTTDSNHPHAVYPNLAADMEVTAVNQLWVADITYIRLETEFVYLAVVLGRLLTPRGGLGAGPNVGGNAGDGGAAWGFGPTPAVVRLGASF